MSTLQNLFLLLVVAYLGGFLMGGRGVRGRGLPSGSEWLVAGLVTGPAALGLLTATELTLFSPLALVATGWIALLVGLTFGVDGERRLGAASVVLGIVAGAIAFAAAAGGTWLVLAHFPPAAAAFPSPEDRLALSLLLGVVLADTSRHVAGWAETRLGARGPVVERVAGVTRTDDVVPILLLSVLATLDPSRGLPSIPAAGAAIGVTLGITCAALLGRTLRTTTFWALLFGFSLLATGIAEQLELAVMTVGLALGLALALASPLRARARELASSVEGAVVLPALFLAGGRMEVPSAAVAWIAAAAIGARLLASVATAALVAAVDRRVRRAGPALALSFFSTGPLGIAVALAVSLRRPGPIAGAVVATAVAASVLGEFVGPPALRRALRRAGELPSSASPEAVDAPSAEDAT